MASRRKASALPPPPVPDPTRLLIALPEPNPVTTANSYATLAPESLGVVYEEEERELVFHAFYLAVNISRSNLLSFSFHFSRVRFARVLSPTLQPFLKRATTPAARRIKKSVYIEQHYSLYYEVDDAAALNAVFFDQLQPRPYPDEKGSFNFDPAAGPAAGGVLVPLVRKDKLATVRFLWHSSTVELDLFVLKYKCSFENNAVVWHMLGH